jgi:hypothetical protein
MSTTRKGSTTTRAKDDERGVTRRDALKLASAVSALGVGLGVTLDSAEAEAAPVQLGHVGQISIKLYKLGKGGETLVHSFDLGALSHKLAKDIAGQYSIKLTNVKLDLDGVKLARTDVIAEQPIELAAAVVAPVTK